MISETLREKDCNIEDIQPLQWLLTTNGRYQHREMFKRKVMYKFLEYKHACVHIPFHILFEYMVNQEIEEFMDKWADLFHFSGINNDQIEKSLEIRKQTISERNKL